MNSVNLWVGVGNMADAPTVRQAGDVEVASFSIATEYSWYNKSKQNNDGTTGGWESKTTWHRITVWRPGESLKKAEKGTRVYIQGRYESTSWQDRNTGETRYAMEVVADRFWVIPKGSNAFQTEPEKQAKKDSQPEQEDYPDAPFPELGDVPY